MDITIYCKEDIKTKLKDSMEYYKARIDAWKKVKRVHKKDGSDFRALIRNFTNCTIDSDYGWDRELRVHFYQNGYGHTYDYINLGSIDSENRLDTPDKVEQAINDLLKKYQGDLERDTEEYSMEDVMDKFCRTVKDALDEVKAKCGNDSTLYYACRDYMKNLY